MRIAFFTPLPPVPSGTADYAVELLPHLTSQPGVEIEIFVDPTHQQQVPAEIRACCRVHDYQEFDARRREQNYSLVLYAIGNNPYHLYAYRTALKVPGVVLLHDLNLHHLLAHVTIVSGEWDEYFRLVEEEGGAKAVERARQVQRGLVGPDYDGLNLNARLLRSSVGAIVHSEYVANTLRTAAHTLPLEIIPHGVKRIEFNPAEVSDLRQRLGLPENELLLGSFGFVKPYKRISSVLAALAQVRSELPPFRYLLVGEEHPHFPMGAEIERHGLSDRVLLPGYVGLDRFWEYVLATDICLSLRYPTAGETSGSLLRELAAGKAVIVSNVGAFAEWPDDCCAKADVDGCEIDQLAAYLKFFAENPWARRAVGENAQAFVRAHCSWEGCARKYHDFLVSVAASEESPRAPVSLSPVAVSLRRETIEPFILGFFRDRPDAQDYARRHMQRFLETLAWVPRGEAGARLLEMGCYLQLTPVLAKHYGYREVRGAYLGSVGRVETKEIRHAQTGERFTFSIDLFDAEKDRYPYPDGRFRTVLCCELIEHLAQDPMWMLHEINRILEPGGFLLLTTPNTASWKSLGAILQGYHPGIFPVFLRSPGDGGGRHAREYAPEEMRLLLARAGFEAVRLETRDFYEPHALDSGLRATLTRAGYREAWGGDTILALARKAATPAERYPPEFYQ
jgi:glycosyltransferase involved in cell wall biosynthesis/SAM-dependent methyltransferase